jgi:tetratricopeptide (TPR) repeat protein
MSFNSPELLAKLSHFVQVAVLLLLFLSAILQTSKFFIDSKLKKINELMTQERFYSLENRPDFHQEMWSMLTGIPPDIFKSYHTAMDMYDKKDLKKAQHFIQDSINQYEKVISWNFKDYDEGVHKDKIAEVYCFASKIYSHLKKHDLCYTYAQKALGARKTHFNFYAVAVAAYNLKKYGESLTNIEEAIKRKPENEEPPNEVYSEIKRRSLQHLNEGK